MKTLYIPAKANIQINKTEIEAISKKLPKNLAIAYSVQYANSAEKIKKILSKNHKITKFVQVLGCSRPDFPKATQAILLISSGRFHGISLSLESGLPVYIFENNILKPIQNNEIEVFKKKQKTSYLKFLNADKVGILVSTKPGQQNLKRAIELKKSLVNKKSYIFIGNEFNAEEFENFPISSWINTACPRLDMNTSIVNFRDLKKISAKS
jgi:2-(3-amino-3-carboxypropyl)histidine synthase